MLETEVCKKFGIQVAMGVGGYEKVQSSSKLVKEASKIRK